jgi:hypothetical protein
MHAANGKVGLAKLFSKPVDLSTGVTEDDSLGNGQTMAWQAQSASMPVEGLPPDVETDSRIVEVEQGLCFEVLLHSATS